MNSMKLIVIAVVMVVLFCVCRLAGASDRVTNLSMRSDPFAGKWKVTVEPDEDARKAGEKTFEDTLVFDGGKFVSEACKKHGFKPAEYEEDTRRFGPATFKAETTSDNEGKAKWTGTLTADQISGEMTWTKKDGSVVHYLYKGEKKR